jgi:hypothetical protein
LKEGKEAKHLESLKEGVASRQDRRFSEEETDGQNSLWRIVKSREPLDLTEEQGSYNKYSERF